MTDHIQNVTFQHPPCTHEFDERFAALSRADNETLICPACGTREALREAGWGEARIEQHIKRLTDWSVAYQAGHERGFEEGREAGYQAGREESFEEAVEEAREEAYTKGREEGFEDGRAEGFEEGREEGYEEGREEGYERALEGAAAA